MDNQKPKLLWIALKQFDKSVDKATWLQTCSVLSRAFEVHFLTAWRDSPIPIQVADRLIRYFPQFGKGPMRLLTRKVLMKSAIKRNIAQLQPQIVLLNCNSNMEVLKVAHQARTSSGYTLLYDLRTLPTNPKNKAAYRKLEHILSYACRHFDGITYITDAMRDYCVQRFALPEHKSAIWTSGVDANMFTPSEVTASGNGTFRLIYHGGIISVSRGLDRLVRAMHLVRDLDVRLTLISSLREQEVTDLIDGLDLKDRIDLVDTVPHAEIPSYIRECDAGVLPFPACDAWNTSSPIKLFEYMSCGKPVIVTHIPAHRNVLAGQPFVFFASDASPESLAQSIREAYQARRRFPELGQVARRQVIAQHTWEIQAQKLGGFIQSVMENK